MYPEFALYGSKNVCDKKYLLHFPPYLRSALGFTIVSLSSQFGRKEATSATGDLYSGLVTHMTQYLHCRYYKIVKNRLDSHQVV